MLGRLRDGRLVTGGWRSAPGLRLFLASHNVSNDLALAYQPRVIADSDHYPFYASRIPALHLDTEKHDDYHRPSDDADKINWDGLRRITEFAYRIVFDAANRAELPQFRNEVFREASPAWMTPRPPVEPPVRLGVNWDLALAKTNVIQITQITSGLASGPCRPANWRSDQSVWTVGEWNFGGFDDHNTILQEYGGNSNDTSWRLYAY